MKKRDKRHMVFLLLATIISVLFIATGIGITGTDVEDVFKMESDGYKSRRKGPPKYELVEFTHKKHVEEYKLGCGQCHHDEDGNPLNDLKLGDAVQECSECHNVFNKTKENAQDIKVHQNAMHTNCKGCHKQINEKSGAAKDEGAPYSCSQCHKRNA